MPVSRRNSAAARPEPRRSRPIRAGASRVAGLVVAGLAVSSAVSQAATLGTCTILVTASGVLTPSPSITTLGTQNPGGAPARATVVADAGGILPSLVCSLGLPQNCFRISITPPSSFNAAPAGGNTNVSFAAAFSIVGSGSLLNLVSLVVLNGTYAVDFNLTATRSAGVFPAGTYQAQETIRCE